MPKNWRECQILEQRRQLFDLAGRRPSVRPQPTGSTLAHQALDQSQELLDHASHTQLIRSGRASSMPPRLDYWHPRARRLFGRLAYQDAVLQRATRRTREMGEKSYRDLRRIDALPTFSRRRWLERLRYEHHLKNHMPDNIQGRVKAYGAEHPADGFGLFRRLLFDYNDLHYHFSGRVEIPLLKRLRALADQKRQLAVATSTIYRGAASGRWQALENERRAVFSRARAVSRPILEEWDERIESRFREIEQLDKDLQQSSICKHLHELVVWVRQIAEAETPRQQKKVEELFKRKFDSMSRLELKGYIMNRALRWRPARGDSSKVEYVSSGSAHLL